MPSPLAAICRAGLDGRVAHPFDFGPQPLGRFGQPVGFAVLPPIAAPSSSRIVGHQPVDAAAQRLGPLGQRRDRLILPAGRLGQPFELDPRARPAPE